MSTSETRPRRTRPTNRERLLQTLAIGTVTAAVAITLVIVLGDSSSSAGDQQAAVVATTAATTTPTSTTAPGSAPVVAGGPVVSTLNTALPGFDIDAVAWEGYWYSRYNLGNVVMMSGLGVGFSPPMEAVMAMAAAVDQGPEDGEHVMMPANAALLKAVYAGGSPEFTTAFNGDPGDLSNFRWDPEAMDTRLLPAAQAQTIMKEVEWAKLFNNGGWAGGVDADIGAMDRFKGMAMFASAKMQSGFALQNLRNADGLFVAVSSADGDAVTFDDETVLAADQYQMLQALSDVVIVLRSPEDFNGVYADEDALGMFGPAVDGLFDKVVDLNPVTILDYDLGAQAMAWFAVATADDDLRARAVARLEEFGDALEDANPEGVLEHARAIRGLLESARVTGNQEHAAAALESFVALEAGYDPATGSFDSVAELTTWEVGDILGALNSLRFNTGDPLSRVPAEQVLVGFFEATINQGGLIRAVVPKAMEASPFEIERLPNDVYFGYPGIPMPGEAGGPHGSAAVDVAAIAFDVAAQAWSPSDMGFVTSATMHASNEMFWIWGFQNGFPEVPGAPGPPEVDAAGTPATGIVVEVIASEFAFDPTSLDLTPGTEVTLRLVNDGAILHNIDIPDLGVFVEAEAGTSAEVTFTVPEGPDSFVWVCNIPGHREAGMEATGSLTG